MTALDLVITPELNTVAGAVSYWRLSGSTSLVQLADAWRRAPLDLRLLPKPVSEQVAFSRAVHDQVIARDKAGVRRFVTTLQRESYAVVEERLVKTPDAPDALKYRTLVHVTAASHDDVEGHGLAPRIVDEIRNATVRHSMALDSNDISTWLTKLALKHGGVGLRDSGGVYFLPHPAMAFWSAAASALESVSAHKVFRIPAMKNDEAIAAVVDALSTEAAQFVEHFAEELPNLGERAIASRKTQLGAMFAKVSMYEKLLDQKMTDVRDRLGSLNAMLTASALVEGEAATG